MGDGTGISWTDATWNPIRGCSRVSEGCRHCYAETMAARFAGPGQPYEGLVRGGRWSGAVRMVREHLADPIRWRKPRRVFVNSMSDLFHVGLSDADIDAVMGVCAACSHCLDDGRSQHVFQMLTKRAERLPAYFATDRRLAWADAFISAVHMEDDSFHDGIRFGDRVLPNVHLGVSIEDQPTADERIPHLLATPAAVRWISLEPMLGPVDVTPYLQELTGDCGCSDCEEGATCEAGRYVCPALSWTVIGGESGPNARPCELDWIRDVVGQCQAAGVPVFVKQLGTVLARKLGLRGKGDNPAEWPEDIRVQEWPVMGRTA